jgi:hypothetical protein
MPLGIRSDHSVNAGDTAELRVALFDENELPVPYDDIGFVRFTVQRPDKSQVTKVGDVEDGTGAGFLRWSDTAQIGEYQYVAQFTLATGQVRSERGSFEVLDPFNPVAPTAEDLICELVWHELEDCFDSIEGGPHLRDETLSYFNKKKIKQFLPDGLLNINVTPPDTNLGIDQFLTLTPDGKLDPDHPILVHGTLLAVIRHLMRSYVEQPTPQGAAVVYEDRRDYLQRWQLIYQQEEAHFLRIVTLWKRQFIGLGKSKMLVTAKAGRLLPAPLRTRNIGRGYY